MLSLITTALAKTLGNFVLLGFCCFKLHYPWLNASSTLVFRGLLKWF